VGLKVAPYFRWLLHSKLVVICVVQLLTVLFYLLFVFVLFYVLFVFVSFCVLFVCKYILYYCHRVSTQLQLTNISYIISFTPYTTIFETLLTRTQAFTDVSS